MRCRESRWGSVRRLLVVRLDNLGDLIMTTPALAALREGLPQARITLLTSPGCASAVTHFPMVDDAIGFDAPWVKGAAGRDASQQTDGLLLERLREEHFDAAVIFTVCTQSALPAALMCRLGGIALRLAHSRESPYDLLTHWLPDDDVCMDGMRHEVARQLDLVASVGMRAGDRRLRFRFGATDVVRLLEQLEAVGISPVTPFFVVHPGASAASRRYPAEGFGHAADLIASISGCTAVFTGDASEIALAEEARREMNRPSVSLAGQLDLGEFAALISRARVLVSNNTAPAHLAAAVGTPVVDLYALTNPQHTPWMVRSRVLNHPVPCRHCLKSVCPQGHHDCLRRVPPTEVARAALELMEPPDLDTSPAQTKQETVS